TPRSSTSNSPRTPLASPLGSPKKEREDSTAKKPTLLKQSSFYRLLGPKPMKSNSSGDISHAKPDPSPVTPSPLPSSPIAKKSDISRRESEETDFGLRQMEAKRDGKSEKKEPENKLQITRK